MINSLGIPKVSNGILKVAPSQNNPIENSANCSNTKSCARSMFYLYSTIWTLTTVRHSTSEVQTKSVFSDPTINSGSQTVRGASAYLVVECQGETHWHQAEFGHGLIVWPDQLDHEKINNDRTFLELTNEGSYDQKWKEITFRRPPEFQQLENLRGRQWHIKMINVWPTGHEADKNEAKN